MKERREDLSAKTPARPTIRRGDAKRQSPSVPGEQGGKQSGHVRRARSGLRRHIVAMVHEQLKPAYQNQPFSTEALDILRDEYLKVLNGEEDNVFQPYA